MYNPYRVEHFRNGGTRLFAYGIDTTQKLDLEDVFQAAPSIFAPRAHESRSAKYVFIPTADMLAEFVKEGWVVTEVRQGGSRDVEKLGFTKHMIRMRRNDHAPNVVGRGDQLYPEVVLRNGHDGTSSYIAELGAFRVRCTNALVASQTFGSIKVKHSGNPDAIMGDVMDATFKVIENAPKLVEQANDWAGTELAPLEANALANAALTLRWEPKDNDGVLVPTNPIGGSELLRARRREDHQNDLWTVFNRVQENILQGGQRFTQRDPETGRHVARRTVRGVNGIDQNRQLNVALWALTEQMAALKAA